jgi:hypothetical protein
MKRINKKREKDKSAFLAMRGDKADMKEREAK